MLSCQSLWDSIDILSNHHYLNVILWNAGHRKRTSETVSYRVRNSDENLTLSRFLSKTDQGFYLREIVICQSGSWCSFRRNGDYVQAVYDESMRKAYGPCRFVLHLPLPSLAWLSTIPLFFLYLHTFPWAHSQSVFYLASSAPHTTGAVNFVILFREFSSAEWRQQWMAFLSVSRTTIL